MSSFHDQWMEAHAQVAQLRCAVDELDGLLTRASVLILEDADNDHASRAEGGGIIRQVRQRCRAADEAIAL